MYLEIRLFEDNCQFFVLLQLPIRPQNPVKPDLLFTAHTIYRDFRNILGSIGEQSNAIDCHCSNLLSNFIHIET